MFPLVHIVAFYQGLSMMRNRSKGIEAFMKNTLSVATMILVCLQACSAHSRFNWEVADKLITCAGGSITPMEVWQNTAPTAVDYMKQNDTFDDLLVYQEPTHIGYRRDGDTHLLRFDFLIPVDMPEGQAVLDGGIFLIVNACTRSPVTTGLIVW